MQLSFTEIYKAQDRKVHNNGDNELAKWVPKKHGQENEKLILYSGKFSLVQIFMKIQFPQ